MTSVCSVDSTLKQILEAGGTFGGGRRFIFKSPTGVWLFGLPCY